MRLCAVGHVLNPVHHDYRNTSYNLLRIEKTFDVATAEIVYTSMLHFVVPNVGMVEATLLQYFSLRIASCKSSTSCPRALSTWSV